MTAKEVRRMTNDAVVHQARQHRADLIRECSQRAAAKITAALPKAVARRIDKAALAKSIEDEFQGLR